MNTTDPGARDYRVTNILSNGEVVLDAEDSHPAHHRRFVAAADLPSGAELGTRLRCYDNGAIELVCGVSAASGLVVTGMEPQSQAGAIELSPTLGRIVHATVTTVAQEFGITARVAAHIVTTWIKVEYLL